MFLAWEFVKLYIYSYVGWFILINFCDITLQLREYIDDTEDYINIQVTYELVVFCFCALLTGLWQLLRFDCSLTITEINLFRCCMNLIFNLLLIHFLVLRDLIHNHIYLAILLFLVLIQNVLGVHMCACITHLLQWPLIHVFYMLLQLELFLSSGTVCLSIYSLVAAIFGMNIPYTWNDNHGYMFKWVSLEIAICAEP